MPLWQTVKIAAWAKWKGQLEKPFLSVLIFYGLVTQPTGISQPPFLKKSIEIDFADSSRGNIAEIYKWRCNKTPPFLSIWPLDIKRKKKNEEASRPLL